MSSVKTKYSPGQEVYFMDGNQIHRDKIESITISIHKDRPNEPVIQYHLPAPGEDGTVTRNEVEVYATRKALLTGLELDHRQRQNEP